MKEREIVKGNMGRREWGIGVKNMLGRRERDSEGEYGVGESGIWEWWRMRG